MIIIKKDDIPELRVNNEFGYVVGDVVGVIRLYNWMITDIEGDCVTLKKVANDE